MKHKKNKSINIFLLLLFIPQVYLSSRLVFLGLGDNKVYSSFYDQISSGYIDSIVTFNKIVGSSDIVYASLAWAVNYLVSDYFLFSLIINFFFILVLFKLIVKYFSYSIFLLCLVVAYVATDFYVFVLLGEIHRLKLALIFFGLLFTSYKRTGVYYSLISLSLLTHFQMALLLPVIKLRFNKFSILVLTIILTSFIYYFGSGIWGKILYYSDFDYMSLSKSIIIGLIFLSFLFVANPRIKYWYLFLFFIIVSMSSIIGGERINIFLIEGGMIALLLQYKKSCSRRKLMIVVVAILLSGYNIFKIIDKYSYMTLMV